MERARTSTLLATAAATKSEATENCSETRSMLNMGRAASLSWKLLVPGAAYPLDISYAMVIAICGRLACCVVIPSTFRGLRRAVQLGARVQVRELSLRRSSDA